MSDVSPGAADQNELDRQRFDRSIREREISVKEREVTATEQEVALRDRDSKRALWFNPLVIAIFAASLAAIGNGAVAFINASGQRALERERNEANIEVERQKAEAARILEVIKTGDPKVASSNMQFLVDTGLISDPVVAGLLAEYLKKNAGRPTVVLPKAEWLGADKIQQSTELQCGNGQVRARAIPWHTLTYSVTEDGSCAFTLNGGGKFNGTCTKYKGSMSADRPFGITETDEYCIFDTTH